MSPKRAAVFAGLIIAAAGGIWLWYRYRRAEPHTGDDSGLVGSASCRGCHEEFYRRWAPSHHGKAMQPFTRELAQQLSPLTEPLQIAGASYQVELGPQGGVVVERIGEQTRRYRILHALGGKNVYYFLTELERGRLQVLPVAYDVRARAWYDTAASAVRHFPDMPDEPLHWRERPYTFNTSCYSCHVSQLTTHYDPETDTYHTKWLEPGINCETCHGPAGEHVRRCQKSEKACREDPRIVGTRAFTAQQLNDSCAPCHAKMIPITHSFRPGDRYFDHYDLISLEDRDFYPDGRDLGENYTFTLWLLNPCQKSGKLSCLHCHTSSGRYRFAGEKTNQACMPCHKDKVEKPEAHTHHRAGSPANRCVACHMPVTTFARMRRSDHSMLPPAPAASLEFGSPNACNLCHTDRDARWADAWVRRWHKRDYQAPILERARLVAAARRGEWGRLPDVLAYLRSPRREPVYVVALIRLLRNCEDQRKWPILRELLKDPSPWVRAAAAEAFTTYRGTDQLEGLLRALRDDYRLVRVRAAATLAGVPTEMLTPEDRQALARATSELVEAYRTRPDDPAGYINLGNLYLSQQRIEEALKAFETALKVDPNNVPALVNTALAYGVTERYDRAEQLLRKALQLDPRNAAAYFNLGLLLGEVGRREEAKQALRKALEVEPTMAAAAYNLCVLEAEQDPGRGLRWCELAVRHAPQEPKYLYSLAFYQAQNGAVGSAIRSLERLVREHPSYADGFMLLGELYRRQGRRREAIAMLRQALDSESIAPQDRYRILGQLRAIEQRQ